MRIDRRAPGRSNRTRQFRAVLNGKDGKENRKILITILHRSLLVIVARVISHLDLWVYDMMDSDNEFTFCQVSSPVNQDGLETNKLASDMGEVTIKEESSNASRSHSENNDVPWMNGLPHNSNSKKQASVGSLSYSVIDTTPSNQAQESNTKAVSSDAENSPQRSSEQRKPMERPKSRAKVPFEKGYSQMDWLKLTRSHPDLAGLKGQSNRRLISMDEVRQHQTEGTMWTVLKGRVYNIAPYMKFHPGGVDKLMKAVGKDCTSLFNKYHAWVNAEFLLEKCLVGTLDDSH